MNKNDIVTIYHDIFTKQKPEGKAKIVAILSNHKSGMMKLTVEFIREPGRTYNRFYLDQGATQDG